tara:strand:+ start:12540 stop:12893 length:354 start_codon:yes stop_codon:yes gene_type:complete
MNGEQLEMFSNPKKDVSKIKTVEQNLEQALKTFKERNKLYGKNYYKFGKVMEKLFPNEVVLKTEGDYNRFGVFVQIVSKITRYSNNFSNGGHKDSIHDTGVYAFIMEELDEFYKEDK